MFIPLIKLNYGQRHASNKDERAPETQRQKIDDVIAFRRAESHSKHDVI